MSETHWIIVDKATGDVLHGDFITDGGHPRFYGWAWDAATQACHQTDRAPDPAVDEIDPATWTWRPSLPILRTRRWEAAKVHRDATINGGCVTALGRVDTDAESRLKISGAVQMADIADRFGQPFAIEWTMADNSVVAHDAAAMIAMGLTVGQFVNGCHAAATLIRAAIDSADSVAAIAAVDITAGYPA